MKYLLLSILSIICIGHVFAQNREDVVYLKNGSIIRGSIIEQIPDKFIKIETLGGNIFVYQTGEIEKITKEPTTPTQQINQPQGSREIGTYQPVQSQNKFTIARQQEQAKKEANTGIKEGFHGEYGSYIGFSDEAFAWGLDAIFGKQFNSRLFVGGGATLSIYRNGDAGSAYIPVYAYTRVNLRETTPTAFGSLSLGYNIDVEGFANGIYIEPSIGYSIDANTRFDLALSIIPYSYSYTYKSNNYTYTGEIYTYKLRFSTNF